LVNTGNLWENWGGNHERWLLGHNLQDDGPQWYFINTDGSFFAWDGSAAANGTMLATLNPIYHDQIDRLCNASANTFNVFVTASTLTIDPVPGYVGDFYVALHTTNPADTPRTDIFKVNVTPAAPLIAAIADQTLASDESTRVIDTSVTDSNGAHILYTAPGGAYKSSAGTRASLLNHTYGLEFTGSYYQNYGGAEERWLKGKDGQWFFIKPDGQFFKWDGRSHQATGTLLAALDPVFYYRPDLLYNAQAGDLAIALSKGLGLMNTGNLHENSGGAGERWLLGAGGQWYFIKPSGEFFAWDGVSPSGGTYLATLDPVYFTDIGRLTDPNLLSFIVSYSGESLTIAVTDGYVGNFWVEASVFDGTTTAKTMFQVTRLAVSAP
jgi:hypothetical protein